MRVIAIHYLNITHSRNIFFQMANIDFPLLAYFIDADMTNLLVKNNTDKLIYIFWNFCL